MRPNHPSPRLTWRWAVLALALVTLVSTALLSTPRRAAAAFGTLPSCAWALQFSPDKINLFYPDEGATYWASIVPIPPGGHLELTGDYPYARYMSFTTYTPLTQAIDGLNDQLIKPDPGATNPFIRGARRDLPDRGYTVTIVNDRIPATGRAQNTLYTENLDGSKSTTATNSVGLVMRVYVPNKGKDLAGGVPLPTITSVNALGNRTAVPACPDVVPSTDLSEQIATLNSAPLPVGGLVAQSPPRWRKFTNLLSAEAGFLLDNSVTGSTLLPPVYQLTDQLLPPGGFFENPDNKYIAATLDQGFGDVLVLRGKAPTTPRTRDGQLRMQDGELRYWSMCVENAQTTMFYGCAFDEQVRLDSTGSYTIVVSTPARRPDNAYRKCGVTWLPAGPTQQALLIMRNMLPRADFAAAIQHLDVGEEEQKMGPYYPAGTYQSTEQFEQRGCDPEPAE